MRYSSRKEVTVKNYETWLWPWVRWLEENSRTGYLHVTAQVVKAYLDHKYLTKEFSSYMRVGIQIADFVNRYLVEKIKVIKPLSHKKKTENVQMPT